MNSSSEEEQSSGVRSGSIVGQLLNARSESESSVTRSTKVVVDENGNKVVQVRKRKRVYSEPEQEKKKGGNFKNIFIGVAVLLIIFILLFGGLFIFRVSSFNSPDFLAKKQQELSALWGAEVALSDLKVEGFSFGLRVLQADFPESSMIKSVTIDYLKGDMVPMGFVTGIFRGEQFYARSVRVVLRNQVGKMDVPLANGEDLWKFNRFETDNFIVEYENKAEGPFSLQGELYARKSEGDTHVLQLKGKLDIKGWKPININISSPAVYVSKSGVQFSIHGVIGEKSSLMLEGEVPNGQSIYERPFTLSGNGIQLGDLTNNAFQNFLQAELGIASDSSDTDVKLTFRLPAADMAFPGLEGSVETLADITVLRLPILREMANVLGSTLYAKPTIPRGKLKILSDGKKMELHNIDIEEQSFLKIVGNVTANPDNTLSGKLNFGVPIRMTARETLEPDPIFIAEEDMGWIKINLRGTFADPLDNSTELVQKAREIRKEKPGTPIVIPQSRGIRPDNPSNTPATPSSGSAPAGSTDAFNDLLR